MRSRSSLWSAAGWTLAGCAAPLWLHAPALAGAGAGSAPAALEQRAPDETLAALSPEQRTYLSHVVTLSNLFFEGRLPGTRGGDMAADYLEFYFRHFGLRPAFSGGEPERANWSGSTPPDASFRQMFTVSGDVRVNVAEASWTAPGAQSADLTPGTDFNVLGVSGDGEVSGPLVFAGYAIPEGPDNFTSFSPHDDLKGKIAVALRFEPMHDDGSSRFTNTSGWSNYASLVPKFRALADRGASAVVLVSPPGAKDPRADRLESAATTRFGRPLDIPVIMLSAEHAERILSAADPEGRSLLALRQAADRGGGVIDLPNGALRIKADAETLQIPTTNVAAVLPGKGALAEEYVVIGAHYDHLGLGSFGSRSPAEEQGVVIHPGADDNASGTAGVLLLAEELAKVYADMPEGANARSILFVGFGAEESGLNGSRRFVENPPVPTSRITAMINMDMIGRLRETLEVGGVGTAEGFEDWLKPIWEESGVNVKTSRGGQGPSDHASFYAADIPVLFFFTGLHDLYHSTADHDHTINFAGGVRVADLVGKVALAIAQRAEPLKFTPTGSAARVGSMRGVSVRLGVAPGSYSDDQPGVVVGEVYPNTSAADAGIRKGDRLVRWNGEELPDVQAMTNRLAEHKPGDVVEVVVVRDGQEVPLKVTLKARQSASQ